MNARAFASMFSSSINHRFCWLVMLLAAWLAPAHGAQNQRPNILFCLADDWSWPHAGAYGDQAIRTPTFDRVAAEGLLFTQAFCDAPSCTPSRAAILTGQAPHRLEEGGNLWGFLPKKFPVYTDLLESAGYKVGFQGKGWGPGNFKAGGYTRNPAGEHFKNFAEFLTAVPSGQPFCFWFGSQDPHRPYAKGAGIKSGLDAAKVKVPPFWPDTPEIRSDILDYFFEVERFDREVGAMIDLLAQHGQLDNTIVVVTSDNGMPFPRCKANLYEYGAHMPLAVRWPGHTRPGTTTGALVNLSDFAPTFLAAAGLKPPASMTARSLIPVLDGKANPGAWDQTFLERERHANVRKGDLSYPMRAIRTRRFLYIRNLRPDRWPAGDPERWKDVGSFGDVDNSPTKEFLLDRRDAPGFQNFFALSFAKRPAEELYDLDKDPYDLRNLAASPDYAADLKTLRTALNRWMKETGDPRATSDADPWDHYPYFGGGGRPARRPVPAK